MGGVHWSAYLCEITGVDFEQSSICCYELKYFDLGVRNAAFEFILFLLRRNGLGFKYFSLIVRLKGGKICVFCL